MKQHRYEVNVAWMGNTGAGTQSYTSYARSHTIYVQGKPVIEGSSDQAFNGDPSRYNPEELLVAALASCHMLWYLHLCAKAGIVVTGYEDRAIGCMEEDAGGSGSFSSVTLFPHVQVAKAGMISEANALHARAHEMCFIANSVRFPVMHQPVAVVG
ncbi:MAG: OsmC family protein [Bacteroidia bacterium]|jgi:organic hydroperoxide reductase OsmC/OhrA